MMTTIKRVLILSALLILIGSCDKKEKEWEGQDRFDQQIYLLINQGQSSKMASNTINPISFDQGDLTGEVKFIFSSALVKENDKEYTITFEQSNNLVDEYNKNWGTDYKSFPNSLVEITPSLTIKKDNIQSDAGEIIIKNGEGLEKEQKYLLALTVKSVNQPVGIMSSAKTLYFAVEIHGNELNKSVLLTRDNYFKVTKNESNLSNIGNVFTMEGLIYVNKFRDDSDVGDVQISTFMGTEEATLIRFGDSGIPGNHLQAGGIDAGIAFKTKKWYHIALVVNNGSKTIYVNGEKIEESTGSSGMLGLFYIGRSYNDNRGISAKMAEIRIWQTARTAEQIKENIYTVKDKDGIFAYWKMNEDKGGKIEDASGNGYDLQLYGQDNLEGIQPIVIVEEKENIVVE